MFKLINKLKIHFGCKPSVLFIVPRLPQYDRASGDLRLYHIIQMLKDHYTLYIFDDAMWEDIPGMPGEKYLSELEGQGIRVVTDWAKTIKMLARGDISAIICEFYHLGLKYIDDVRKNSKSCTFILDSVDVHFSREKMMADILGDREVAATAAETKRHELQAYGLADQVWVVSEPDSVLLLTEGIADERVKIIPNIHEVREAVPPLAARDPQTLLFVGGFKHQPNVDAIIYFHTSILPLIRKEHPSVHVKIVGDSPPEDIQRLASDTVTVYGYVPSTKPFLDETTVSVVPLRYGAGLKGKVGEALSNGVPLVTTSVGAQGMSLVSGEDCFIADTPEEFAGSVIGLLEDQQLCAKFSSNGIKFMKSRFGYDAAKTNILDVVNQACSSVKGIGRR